MIKESKKPLGFWVIGGIFAFMEWMMVLILTDISGWFPASVVVGFWIVAGAYPRYKIIDWWLGGTHGHH